MATQAPELPGEVTSVFQSDLPLETKLERARTELLDLSARNRLLNMPRSGKATKALEIIDEQASELYRLCVKEQRALTFQPGRRANGGQEDGLTEGDPDEIEDLEQPEDESVDDRGVASRHADTRLQTRLTPAGLQKRLLDLYYDARTLEEEQGVNILFLALGSLKWVDPNNAKNHRFAPLILIPVGLERGNAAEKFKLRWRQEEVAANLSLEAMLERHHGIKLPAFDAGDDFDPARYITRVAEAVTAKQDWSVQANDVVLGFFSFAKFLMYRDLDPLNWPAGSKLSEHDTIRSLVSDGFDDDQPLFDEDTRLDGLIKPIDLTHIVDSDSSQSLAVHEVRRGRSLVIQGPPGTGKSQTIANLIGAAVADGKTVLFVAEKMAALEVVKRRLDNNGVGDICLELHSNKANKKAVLGELDRTWQLGAPRGEDLTALNNRLEDAREGLNAHSERLHRPSGAAEFTPYQVIGHLVRLRQLGHKPTDLVLEGTAAWTQDDLRTRSFLIDELAERIQDIGVPAEHVWRDVRLWQILPIEAERLGDRITAVLAELQALRSSAAHAFEGLELPAPARLANIATVVALAERLVEAPILDASALGSNLWNDRQADIEQLLSAGEAYAQLREALATAYKEAAWSADLAGLIETFGKFPADLAPENLEVAAKLERAFPTLQSLLADVSRVLGRSVAPLDFQSAVDMLRVAERVAVAPDADVSTLGATLWETGVDRAGDLAASVQARTEARTIVGDGLSDAGWPVDLTAERKILASHGTGFLRLFSGEWRRASRSVRSYLTDPKAPLDRQLAILDAQERVRTLDQKIQGEQAFAEAAFGSTWRGLNTQAEPLQALVEWMRSLKGLGAEPRIVAGRSPDKARLARLVGDLSVRLGEVSDLSEQLLRGLGNAMSALVASQGNGEPVTLAALHAIAEEISRADREERGIAARSCDRVDTRLADLRRLEEAQKHAGYIEGEAELGQSIFGSSWQGKISSWPTLRSAATWILDNLDIHKLTAKVDDRVQCLLQCRELIANRDALCVKLDRLLTDLGVTDEASLQPGKISEAAVDEVESILSAWAANIEQLSKWVAYLTRADRARSLGLSDLVSRLHRGALFPELGRSTFEMTYYEAVYAGQVKDDPPLGEFDGDLHDRLVQTFRDLDQQRIKQSALEVVRAHHKRIPSRVGGRVGPLGILRSEMQRRRGHMPIRQLMQKAAPAIQALKPVFMMSPLSVAQFLQPGCLNFDLLVMDEASQIQPVDALGAIARCKQVVVVGDPQQLPPTAFFSKMTGNTDAPEDEDGTAKVADIESILGLFTARGLPMRMLRWHYRSRHESLIAVSNQQFYENKLFIVPSPFTQQAGLGLRFHHVTNGIFETGSSRTNPVEAKVVAQAIVQHAIANPDLSLGVVAFSVAQRRAILDQLELLRRTLPPEQESFFQAHHAEPFFVKNLENVQGDERDVIFISVGYGPTGPGLKPPMRFGPLGQEGGERRLNVLISRAKRRTEVFSSMTDDDIDQDFASGRKGVFAFKMFMHFARTGKMAMAEATARDAGSPFEEQVAAALTAKGFLVHRQVGLAGFFIDLAIGDPERADRYILGIECDGAAYHGAKSARDRDRLRQAILEDHGWIIQRVWSTDWFRRPNAELEKVVKAIASAKAELDARGERQRAVAAARLEIVTVDREHVTEIGLTTTEAQDLISIPYVEAQLIKPSHLYCDLHDAPTGSLTQLAEQVVAIEGPVHLDEIVNRVRDAWGLKRAGGRIQDAVERALAVAVRQHRLAEDDDFYQVPGAVPSVRDRCTARSTTLRKPEMLPPAEIKMMLLHLIGKNFGATEDQVVQAASRAFGFKSTSSQLRDVIGSVLGDMVRDEQLALRDGLITIGPNAPAMAAEPPAPTPLERLIAGGESECVEFKQTLRWDVRQQMLNRKLEDVVVKTVAALGNHKGGTLLIGVCDDGTVAGIEADLATLEGSRDRFELHLHGLLKANLPETFCATKVRVSFLDVVGQVVCRLEIDRSRIPLFVNLPDRTGQKAERLFVRLGNASHELRPSEIPSFVSERFTSLNERA